MYLTGFADEAGPSIDAQIEATNELGWENIESRNIDGVNIHDITDAKFDEVCQKLSDAGVKINCFGSAVANWSKDPRKEEDFQSSIEELKRALTRMQVLGTDMIRAMSFVVVKDEQPDSHELEKMIFEKVGHLVKMCEDAGVYYLHENCSNYGGMSHEHTLKLLDNIKSDNFRLVFDTGNPVCADRRIGDPPYGKQSSWEFYSNVKEFVHYVHIKDGRFVSDTDGIFAKGEYSFPGEGDGDVKRIVGDLLASGYDGGFSIEPHMAVVFHEGDNQSDDGTAAKRRFETYVEYGRRMEAIIKG